MRTKVIIIISFILLCSKHATKAEEILYDHKGYPTIIHSETDKTQAQMPKFWCLHVDTEDGGFINLDYRLAGEILIREKKYVRVVFSFEEMANLYENDFLLMSAIRPYGNTHADTLFYRQEGDKVYCLQRENNKDVLIIDYGLKEGDEFTDANGEVFIVKETGTQNNNKNFFRWYSSIPKKLILISQQTGEEDIWIEGLGSKYWGITPSFLLSQNKVFTKLRLQPSNAQVSMGYGGNLLLEPKVNTENYKAEMIDLGGNYYGEDIFINYEFLDDTLRVEGVKLFEHFAGYSYAECLIDGGRIDIMVKRFSDQDEIRESPYIFDVKIPGFKPGTYQVGMPGREYVTLECKGGGTTSISEKSLTPVAPREGGAIYDLSGRKVNSLNSQFSILNSQLKRKSLYIQNGKKVAIK